MEAVRKQAAAATLFKRWRADWNLFIREVLGAELDAEQRAIVTGVQTNRRVSVTSGTSRGKDFVAACIAIAFLYLTPKWMGGSMIENTKVIMTAPTGRQVTNIMMAEVSRLWNRARTRGFALPGRLTESRIGFEQKEWFLTGFKADERDHEAWSGLHASHILFIVTEASGVADNIFDAIEGNLQGDSRIVVLFNPNRTTGYAAKSQRDERWKRFRLNSLTAPNVLERRIIFPGQVDYEWVTDKLMAWCDRVPEERADEGMDDFEFEGVWYRPNDLFRRKVLGKFPKEAEDVLLPQVWIEAARERWKNYQPMDRHNQIIGVDVAGMGRDNSVMLYRQGAYVEMIDKRNSGGKAAHMQVAGEIVNAMRKRAWSVAVVDTIGEGAGVYARAQEVLGGEGVRVISGKNSEGAKRRGRELTDDSGQMTFSNMRAYMYWAVREWLNPANNTGAMLPPGGTLAEEAAEVHWHFNSMGKIQIEAKEDIKARLGYSPDELDALALTFHPAAVEIQNVIRSGGNRHDDIDEDIYY